MSLRSTLLSLLAGSLLGSSLLWGSAGLDQGGWVTWAQSPDGVESESEALSEDGTDRAELSAQEEEAIQAVISQQLEAFQQQDAETAFSFASPGIQDQFGSAERFVAMVRSSYAPVYNAETAEFLELAVVRGTPAQQVRLLGPEGDSILALYIMEQQEDDSWRISACLLQPSRQPEGIGV